MSYVVAYFRGQKAGYEKGHKDGYRDGIRAAAEFMSQWDKQIDWPYRIEDVILCRFNLSKRKRPRKKRKDRICSTHSIP